MRSRLGKIIGSPWLAALTLLVLVAVRAWDPAFLESVRLRYFDTLITSTPPTPSSIVTVNIDEAALDHYGQWPFTRSVYAHLIDDLYAHHAGIVVMNVLMTEPDRMGGDAVFAHTLERWPVILPNMPADRMKNTPRQPSLAVIGSEYLDHLVTYPGILANIPVIESRAAGVGVVNTLPELDGVNRRIPLVVAVGDHLYPSLAMETLRVAAQDTTTQIKLSPVGVDKLRIPQFGPIATDPLGRIWIDWSYSISSYSMMQLPDDFHQAIVIVGVSAAGVGNPVPTALGALWPHDVQAAVLATVMSGSTIQRPDWAEGAELLAILGLGLLVLGLSRWTYVGLGTTLLLLLGLVPLSWWAFASHRWLVDVTAPIGLLLITTLHLYGAKFVREYQQKLQIKKQFGTYLSPALVEKLQRQPELLRLGGESRVLSIMFTDVRGFTTISEHYGENVQGLTQVMNRYMTAMTRTILNHQGTLDKYIGDAQMAFWNAPLDDADHAWHAVQTALSMIRDLETFNAMIAAEGVPPFGMGIGINTGMVVVGNMGSTQRFDYTCLGDAVNLASRLEGQSKPYHVPIILGPQTAEMVRGRIPVAELDCLAVKGKSIGVRIYTIAEVASDHATFLHHYYAGQWTQALRVIPTLAAQTPVLADYYHMMQTRLEAGCQPTWTGIYTATSK